MATPWVENQEQNQGFIAGEMPKAKDSSLLEIEQKEAISFYSYLFAGLGALGTAVQNYQAVAAFAKGSLAFKVFMHSLAVSAGGICSGLINYGMNLELLEDFRKRLKSKEKPLVERLGLNAWQTLQYYSGLFVFIVTGILFGLMAFTFAMSGPLGLASIAIGVFVAGVMTIQEVETWLQSYEPKSDEEKTLTGSQKIGKWVGHIIAAGNVIALSLLFALSLSQALLICNVALVPALIAGFAVAFSFGAFTEFYFYNFHLSSFCSKFNEKIDEFSHTSYANLGLFCAVTNALVNAALTYVGVMMLGALLVSAHLALPPLAIVTTLAVFSAIFAGSASFTLGIDFWIRTFSSKKKEEKSEAVGENEQVVEANKFSTEDSSTTEVDKPLAKEKQTTHGSNRNILFANPPSTVSLGHTAANSETVEGNPLTFGKTRVSNF